MLPVDYDNMDLLQLREELWSKVADAFQHSGRLVGYRDLRGADYRRLTLEMLECVEAKIRAREGQLKVATLESVWQFPHDPWVEYEPTDEAWARPLGFGLEIVRWTTGTSNEEA